MAGEVLTILVIDDEESMRDSCSQIFLKDGFRAETAENGEVGLKKIEELHPHLVLVDLKMAGLSGFEVLERGLQLDKDLVFVVITGYATVESAVEAMKKGAYDFLPKPFSPEELRMIIRRGLERRLLLLETKALRREKKLMEENFVTMVSHQLRSPLAAIEQYFEVLLAGMVAPLDAGVKEMLTRAEERLAGLLQLINDWLDLSRLGQVRTTDAMKPVALRPLLGRLTEFWRPAAAKSGVTLSLRKTIGSDRAWGDEQSLEQIFSNLLSNAVKYNRPGGTVALAVREEVAAVAVEIRDTGVGIPAEHMPRLFDPFFRVKRTEDREEKGTGLGLPIAKKIAESHGGRIEVESKEGRGSTFTVFLPKEKKETDH
ncbi:MAG: response regulator [Candidatus Aminicenantes bacterium]|nr:response regulator [Candidatus Aminicenantes bacterium]